jgi:hypothetical protein
VSDFLVEGDFHELLLVEEAGNVLPSFQTTFWLEKKPEILERLNEGNALQLALGRDEVNVSNLDLLILKKQMSKMGASRFLVKISGLYNTPGYLNDCKIKLTSKQDGISAIKSIASSWFKVDTNISSSKDSQLELGKTYTHIFEGEYIDLEYCFMPHTRFEFKPKQYQCAVNYVKHINKWREV